MPPSHWLGESLRRLEKDHKELRAITGELLAVSQAMPAGSDDHVHALSLAETSGTAAGEVSSTINYLVLFELIPSSQETTARNYLKAWIESSVRTLDDTLEYLRAGSKWYHRYRGAPQGAAKLARAVSHCRTTVGAILEQLS